MNSFLRDFIIGHGYPTVLQLMEQSDDGDLNEVIYRLGRLSLNPPPLVPPTVDLIGGPNADFIVALLSRLLPTDAKPLHRIPQASGARRRCHFRLRWLWQD